MPSCQTKARQTLPSSPKPTHTLLSLLRLQAVFTSPAVSHGAFQGPILALCPQQTLLTFHAALTRLLSTRSAPSTCARSMGLDEPSACFSHGCPRVHPPASLGVTCSLKPLRPPAQRHPQQLGHGSTRAQLQPLSRGLPQRGASLSRTALHRSPAVPPHGPALPGPLGTGRSSGQGTLQAARRPWAPRRGG